MRKKTIYDVAKEAGVSISTVSRVINGAGNVKESTKLRVLAACEGYTPNAQARELTSHKTRTVCIVINHSPEYFFMNEIYSNVMLGVSVVAKSRGYRLLLNITSDEEDVCSLYYEKKVSGVIVMGVNRDGRLVNRLSAEKIPFVTVGSFHDQSVAQVDINDRKAMKKVAEYLISMGHQRIGIITGSQEYTSCCDRIDGYRDAMRENHLKIDEAWIKSCDSPSPLEAEELAKRLLTQNPRVTAILSFNDSIALAVYKAAKDLNISVPDELSVTGFDDSTIAGYTSPMLTSVRQPSYEKGEKAMNLLADSLESDTLPRGREELDCVVVYRESCARARDA